MQDITIVQADHNDAAEASSIMNEVATWLKDIGQTLWFPEELTPESLAPSIKNGELFLVMMKGEPVGTVIFQLEDTLFWPDMPQGEAAYIHKVIVRRSVAGAGVSRAIISWAREKAFQMGRRFLRLDTEAARTRLCALYESSGFTVHSYRQVGRHYVARYEMKI